MRRASLLVFLAATSACGGSESITHVHSLPNVPAVSRPANALLHQAVGFSVDSPDRASKAASEGVTSTILYGGSASPNSALTQALDSHGITQIDAAVSGVLFYWECHRTHTVAPPPASYGYNSYCLTDEDPRIATEADVLRHVRAIVRRDAARPYVIGYWVLDDWVWWDYGSAQKLLQRIRAVIASGTPGRPAICGFGAGFGKGTKYYWDPGTAKNYSNAGCDAVGWYNYTPFGLRKPSSGTNYNWAMQGLLPAMARSLQKYGWNMSTTPLIGIGQAWGGRYGARDYQPGITATEMQTQAAAFCSFGASAISWYAWDDSQDVKATLTPNNSAQVAAGIADGLAACRSTWGS